MQSASAMNAIDLSFNAIPTILLGIMLVILLLFYDVDKKLPKVKAELAVRHEAEKAGEDKAVNVDASEENK